MGNRAFPSRWVSITGAFAIAAALAAMGNAGCDGAVCGTGTVEVNGVCTATGVVLRCAAGFKALDNRCVPDEGWVKLHCGENTEYDPATNMCKGTGTGGPQCTKRCPQPGGGLICIEGRVFEGVSLYSGAGEPTPLGPTDGAVVKVYNPLDFVANPSGTPPIKNGIAAIEKDGCFVVPNLEIPFAGFFAIAVDDAGDKDVWALAALGHTPTPGQNVTNLEVPAFKTETANVWGNEILSMGSMLMVFQDLNNNLVDGVTPTLETLPPPWTVEGKALPPVLYFGDSLAQAPAPAPSGPGVTGKSGIAVVRKAPVKTYGGVKAKCTIESKTGGSSPNTIFIGIRKVSGC